MKLILIVGLGSLIAWLFAGRQISMLLDRIATVRIESLPVRPVTHKGGFLSLGGRILFMTGHTTSWRRHRYYRLIWEKRSGAMLEILWRYEQWRYPAFGWTGADMTREGATGLLSVNIQSVQKE